MSISHSSPTTRLCVDAASPPVVHLADCVPSLSSQRWSIINGSFLRNDQGFFLQSPVYNASLPKPSSFAMASVSLNSTSSINITSLFTLVPFSSYDTFVAPNSGFSRSNLLHNPGFDNFVPPFGNLSVDGSFLFSVCDWIIGNSLTLLNNSRSITMGSFSLSLYGYGLISQAIRTRSPAQYLLTFQMNYNRTCMVESNQTLLRVHINDSSTVVLQDIAMDTTEDKTWESVHLLFTAATNVVRLSFQGLVYDGNVGSGCKGAETGPVLDNVEVYYMKDIDVISLDSSGKTGSSSNSNILKVVLAPVVLGSILLGALCTIIFYKVRQQKVYKDALLVSNKPFNSDPLSMQPRRFSLVEILRLTKNFSDELVIGQGGFGTVFRVSLPNQSLEKVKPVAVKRGFKEFHIARGRKLFETELSTLLRVHHCHVLDFVGYCNDQDEKILLTEYMDGDSLHHQLHVIKNKDLTWQCRMRIAYQVACGLNYLHDGANPPILHLDIKPANILLTSDLSIAKVSDFGICKITQDVVTHTQFRGTVGYADPQFFNTGRASKKTDVYSYGILLLELLTGRCASQCDDDDSLHVWASPFLSGAVLDDDIITMFLEQDLRGTPLFEVRSIMEITKLCLQTSMDRPSMFQVLNMFAERLPWVIDSTLIVDRNSSEDGYAEPFSALFGR